MGGQLAPWVALLEVSARAESCEHNRVGKKTEGVVCVSLSLSLSLLDPPLHPSILCAIHRLNLQEASEKFVEPVPFWV